MKRYEALEEILAHIWSYVEEGVGGGDNAMSTPVFATRGPGARTVALRDVDRNMREFLFHTDVRSPKVEQLVGHSQAVWVGWDPDLSQQFQFMGETTVHRTDDLADAMWESESQENLDFYYKRIAPGKTIEEPMSVVDREEISEKRARKYFATVRTVVDEIVWLHIHPDLEYRARFEWTGSSFEGEWIVP